MPSDPTEVEARKAPAPAQSPAPGPVARRAVFYVSGFDPRGPGHYHALYRTESARQALLTGLHLEVGPMVRVNGLQTRWSIASADGASTDYGFLRWDDLIRANWTRSQVRLLFEGTSAYRNYQRHGIPSALKALSHGYWFVMVYPLLLGYAIFALCFAGGAAAGVLLRHQGWLLAGLLGVLVTLLLMLLGQRLARLLKGDWLLRVQVFSWRQGSGEVAGLEERLDRFAEQVRRSLDDPGYDEVLLVGHSVGASLAVCIAARAAALPAGPAARARFGVLTLGQGMAGVGLVPAAEVFRRDLAALGQDQRIAWLDVTAPPDGASIALTDPVAACGLPPTGRPRLISARFHAQFAPEVYRQVRRNRFRLHFQYIMASEIVPNFDYFRATGSTKPFRAYLSDPTSP